MKASGNKILITGGATGIGFGLAERFVSEGNTVIVCSRRQPALQEAMNKLPQLITHQFDLASVRDREELFRWITDEHPDVNVLINNAGIQNWMNLTDDNFYERAKEEIAINIDAPLHLTSLFIKHKALTTLINISSGLSFVPLIKTPVYSATKAFIHSLTLSIRELLKEKKIEVIEIIPPALNTDLGGKGLHDFAPPVKEFIEAIFKQLNEGRKELTFGFTEALNNAGAEVLKSTFQKMNQLPESK